MKSIGELMTRVEFIGYTLEKTCRFLAASSTKTSQYQCTYNAPQPVYGSVFATPPIR